MFKIDKGVTFGRYDYPFMQMEIGDSFFAAVDAPKVRGAAAYFMKFRTKARFKVRKVEGGCRCWRVE